MATNEPATKGIETTVGEIENQFYNLGGTKFPQETDIRVKRFYSELSVKRIYNKFTTFESDVDEMIIINKIRLFSFCEHHLLPFFGYVSIGYIPDGKILGLSKFQRLVDKVASRPTIQETLTVDIAEAVQQYLKPKGVGVVINCQHTCMFGRGIERPEIGVSSQVLIGNFKQNIHTRQEFFNRISE